MKEMGENLERDASLDGVDELSGNDALGDELFSRAVWITRLADDNLGAGYNTQGLLDAGNSLTEVLDMQSLQLIRKYVNSKQILAIAGTLDIANISFKTKDMLLRLANVNIDACKNSNNSYGLMTFSKAGLGEELSLGNKSVVINSYKDLRQAMLNEWGQIRQEFYSSKS
ncbi:DUF1357 family protein [Borrelia sp. RT1S]|uniref:DUF1357 family protein n=1 Tax=Borrelia sp. RT1S TaxID=2898580 RepID=UPI001E45373A|nr:DUF1357 family protein [Borrelia sp. RT1S]UGQ17985.1 DUF1357 family protein [Borrelia sp. RT1S]